MSSSLSLLLAGHRGSGQTDAPHARRDPLAQAKPAENSLPSIVQAFRDGADFVEIDAIRTADDQLVVTHADRLSDHVFAPLPAERVGQLTLEDLRRLPFGKKGDGRIATLAEVLETVAAHAPAHSPIALNIEIKDTKGTDAPRDSIVPLVLDAVAKGPLPQSRILFSSFALEDLKEVHAASPDAKIGLLFDHATSDEGPMYRGQDTSSTRYRRFTPERLRQAMAAVPLTHAHPEIHSLNEAAVAEAARHGLGLNSWGLKEKTPAQDRAAVERAVALSVRHGVSLGVITDFVPQMREVLAPHRLDRTLAARKDHTPEALPEPPPHGPAVR